ncbi:MAG: AAA family ATPase [Arcobacteraceae bacterium]
MKKIILIVGPSGVGKDTLIDYVKKELNEDDDYNFINRYITSIPDENEKNYYLEEEAFRILDDQDFFISAWYAHKNCYGIAKNDILEGINIISISREHISDFEEKYEHVTTIHVTLPKLMLLERLRLRRRESEAQIMQRVKRSYEKIESKNLIEFENVKKIDKSAKAFMKIIKSI